MDSMTVSEGVGSVELTVTASGPGRVEIYTKNGSAQDIHGILILSKYSAPLLNSVCISICTFTYKPSFFSNKYSWHRFHFH